MRHVLGGTLVVVLGIVGVAQPAQAMNYSAAPLTSWAFTDSAAPSTPSAQPAGAAPLGSTVDVDGARHTRRIYYTFDISGYAGQVVHKADLWTSETKVTDCGTAAPVQVWRTGPVTGTTTWNDPPADLELVAERNLGKGVICPGAHLTVDMASRVTEALARDEKTITFGVRLSGAAETDPAAWRSVRPLNLSMSTNNLPVVSELRLRSPDRPCGTLVQHPVAGGITYFTAVTTDADPAGYPTTTFEAWPIDEPDQRRSLGTSSSATPVVSSDLRAYADGTVLAWSAQARDADDAGEWAEPCHLTVDNTAPANAPVILSRKYGESQYPGSGGPGVAGTFVLDALRDRDVVGFDWYEQQDQIITSVAANHPGGRARIKVTPKRWGPDRIQARSVDAAGNRGPWRTYDFYVRDTAPRFDVDVTGVGTPSTITLHPPAAETTAFGFTVDGGAETRVPVVDGKGTGTITFASRGYKTVVASSYAGRKLLGSESKQIYVSDAPGVTSAEFLFPAEPLRGTRGTFTFSARTTGVVAFRYDFGNGEQRIEAGADGTATLSWTADEPGFRHITVVSETADGTRSAAATDQFWVLDTHPAVWSEAGSCCPNRDGVGRPVRVWLSSDLPGVTGFVYSYDGGAEKTVTGGGNTYVEVTPSHVGDASFTARAVLADGTLSPPTTITVTITDAPLVTVDGPYGELAVTGREATLVIVPATPDVVSYRYHWGWFEESPQTVDAAPDGTARVTWTPEYASTEMLNVVAVARDGSETDVRQMYVDIEDPSVEYYGSWNDWSPSGGAGEPGRLGFAGVQSGLHDATVAYLWHVGDEPVQEVAPAEDAMITEVSWTPSRSGEHVLYVQRRFTDGALSPIREYRLLVG
jgi:hypothetical protein